MQREIIIDLSGVVDPSSVLEKQIHGLVNLLPLLSAPGQLAQRRTTNSIILSLDDLI